MTRNKTMPPPTVTVSPKVLVSLITALIATKEKYSYYLFIYLLLCDYMVSVNLRWQYGCSPDH